METNGNHLIFLDFIELNVSILEHFRLSFPTASPLPQAGEKPEGQARIQLKQKCSDGKGSNGH